MYVILSSSRRWDELIGASKLYLNPTLENLDGKMFQSKLAWPAHRFQFHSHFWYLNFVCIVLSSKVVPRARRPCRSWIAVDGCRRAVLSSVDADIASLKASDGHRDGSVVESDRLAQFRVVEWLWKASRKYFSWNFNCSNCWRFQATFFPQTWLES